MLTVLTGEAKFSAPCTLLLGGFDGFHLAHRTLYVEAKKFGLPIGLTSMTGLKHGGDLFTAKEREIVFQAEGFDFVYEMSFDETLKNTSAQEFLDRLLRRINARVMICGEDFRFGKDALGTPELISKITDRTVRVLPMCFDRHSEKVSMNTCKRYLQEGNMHALNGMLKEDARGAYFILGQVEHGRKVGRTYGFPTLNLTIPREKISPREGVYGGLAVTPKGRYNTIVNIGARPTFSVFESKLEAYLDGFSGNLYGEEVQIFLLEFYRDIAAFASATHLKEQLERDVTRLRKSNYLDLLDVK